MMLFLIDIHSTHPVIYLVHTIYITPHRGGVLLEEEIVRVRRAVPQQFLVALQLVCCQADDWGQCSRDTCSDLYYVKFAPEDDGHGLNAEKLCF